MSDEMQSILRILGDIQAQNAEMNGRMERLEAKMEAGEAAASRIETKVDSTETVVLEMNSKVDKIEVKVNALDWRALTWRRLDWSSLPHDTRKGALTYLSTEDSMGLNYAMTNKEARPHFIESYKGMRIPAFDKLLYTEKDDFRVLRWVMEKGIDLQGFRMEVDGEKRSGRILHGLMVEKRVSEDDEDDWEWVPRDEAYLEVARYYATRGRLIDVDEVISELDDEGEEVWSETALTRACRDRHMDIVKGLLAAGADCNKSDNSFGDNTPLKAAASYGHADAIDVLVAAGADVDKAGFRSPLFYAAANGHVDAAKALLKAGADTEAVGTENRTPIHYAAERGLVEVVKLLVDAGANKEKVDDRGYTPLMIATHRGKVEVVKVLLAAGVDLKKKNSQGKTALAISKERYAYLDPYSIATNQGREQITSLLEQAGAKA